MRQPRFPTGANYAHLVLVVECYGIDLGAVLCTPSIKGSTFRRWLSHAQNGREPYRSWCSRFVSDWRRQRELATYVRDHGQRPDWADAFRAELEQRYA